MNFLIKRCLYGQVISFAFGLFYFTTAGIPKDICQVFTLLPFFSTLLVFNLILTLIENKPVQTNTPFLKIFFCSITEVLINFLIVRSLKSSKTYYSIFINQLNYPMSLFYKVVIKKERENITMFRFLAYLVVISFCFGISYFCDTDTSTSTFSLLGTIYMLLANVAIITNIYLQCKVLQTYNPRHYTICMSLFAVPILFIVSLTLDYKNIPSLSEILQFYKTNYLTVCGYASFLTLIYCLGPLYIQAYKPISFQSSLLSTNAFTSMIFLIYNGINVLYFFLYLVCIASSVLLTYTNSKEIIWWEYKILLSLWSVTLLSI